MVKARLSLWAGVVMAVCCCGSAARAQDGVVSADEMALVKLEHEWMDAENRHDAGKMNVILDDRFLATFDARPTIDKSAYMKGLTTGEPDPSAQQDIVNEKLVIDGNMAVAVMLNTMQGTRAGKPYHIAYRITVTFVRHGDHWAALALQGGSVQLQH